MKDISHEEAFNSKDQFVYRPHVVREGSLDVVTYNIFKITAQRTQADSFVYGEEHLVNMDNAGDVMQMMHLLANLDMMKRAVALVHRIPCHIGHQRGTKVGITVHGSMTVKEITFRTVLDDMRSRQVNAVMQAQQLCSFLNGQEKNNGYYVRRYMHHGVAHRDGCMVVSPSHEKVVSFSELNCRDPEGHAKAIADLLNNPPKGSYNMVDLWGSDPRAVILFRPLDGSKTTAYPIMSTDDCKNVITTITSEWAD